MMKDLKIKKRDARSRIPAKILRNVTAIVTLDSI